MWSDYPSAEEADVTLVAAALVCAMLLSAGGVLFGFAAMVSMIRSGDIFSAIVALLSTLLNSFLLGLALHGWWA